MVRPVASPFRQLRGVAAFAGIKAIDDVFIPAALAGGDGAFPHELHHFIRLGAVTHQISKAGDRFNSLPIDVLQHSLNGCQVGVEAGDHGVGHGRHRVRVDSGCWSRIGA